MSDSPDSGRRRNNDAEVAVEVAAPERPRIDQHRETLDKDIKKIIEDAITATAQHESIGSALKSIALKAFERGYDKDVLIKQFAMLDVFAPKGILARALRTSIIREVNKYYRAFRCNDATGQFDAERKEIVEGGLKIFLGKMEPEDCITSFFEYLLKNEYKLDMPLLVSDDNSGSVSKTALLRWALSRQTLGSIASKMGTFVERVITEEYEVYTEVAPEQYIETALPSVIGIDTSGAVIIYFSEMDALIKKVCRHMNFERFMEILSSHDDLVEREYDERSTGTYFHGIKECRRYLHKRWDDISSKRDTERGETGHREVRVDDTRRTTARRICSVIFPPGHINSGGSGSLNKARVVLMLPEGGVPVTSFYIKADMCGNPQSVQSFVREKVAGSDSPVAAVLRSNGIKLGPRAFEINSIAADVVKLVSGRKANSGGSRHHRKKH